MSFQVRTVPSDRSLRPDRTCPSPIAAAAAETASACQRFAAQDPGQESRCSESLQTEREAATIRRTRSASSARCSHTTTRPPYQDDTRQGEEQPSVALDLDAEHGQVGDDRSADDPERKEGTDHGRCGNQQQYGSHQLGGTRTETPPRLHPEPTEDVHRLRGAGELEEEGL